MRITAAILLILSLHVTAKSVSQTITLTGKNIPLKTVFTEIEKQCGYLVLYSRDVIDDNQVLSVEAKNEPLLEFLNETLPAHELDFVIENKTILVKKKPVAKKTTLPISGIVKGVDGKPLANVSVVVKGTDKGTTTDAEGKFNIDVNPGEVLVVSSVGFGAKEVKVNTANSNLVIALDISSSPLDEVQIIAYGETSKRFNTGNVSTIKSADIEKQPVNNPLLALQGRVPGVFIEQATGFAGTGVKVRIQGQNSLSRGSDPLYVIDGIPYSSQLLPSLSGILGNSSSGNLVELPPQGNPLNFINPADIESIDILKDADATSIYGSRAAAGAILITTKKAKAGKTTLSVNLQSGGGKVTRMLDVLNTQQYLEMRNEALKNDGITQPGPTDFDINGAWDQNRDVDWQKELIGGTARYNDAQVSITGGTSTTQFLVNGGFHHETTVFPGSLNDRKGSLHFNLNNTSADQRFKFQLDGKYLVDNNHLISGDLTSTAIQLSPNAPAIYNPDGTLNWSPLVDGSSSWVNPLAALNSKYKNKTKNLIGSALLSYQLIPELEVRTNLGYTDLQIDEVNTSPLAALMPELRSSTTASSRFANGSIHSWSIEPQVNYKLRIGTGKFDALAGMTFLESRRRRQDFNATGFSSDLQLEDIASAAAVTAGGSVSSLYRYVAGFAKVNYNLKDRYILNATARRDGSSRYGSENKFSNFGSIAAAWLFSNENFVSNTFRFLSFGKLRVSYGTTGNDQIGDYQFMSLYVNRTRPAPYQNAVGISPYGLANPLLQWEQTKKIQAGLDLGFSADRVLLNINYYRNRSSNQLQPYGLPQTTGFGQVTVNLPATIQNSGWELALSANSFTGKNFTWNTSLNLTIPKNKLVSYPGIENSAFASEYVIGQPITSVKVFRLLGVDTETGLYQVADKDGKPTDFPDYFTDRTVLINLDPKFYGGFKNTLTYKSLSLDLLFQFVKQVAFDYSLGYLPGSFGGPGDNQPITVLDRWQKPGDQVPVQRYTTNFNINFFNAFGSDAVYANASYIRLKNLSLSWQLPKHWLGNEVIDNVRLYVQGQNLITFTNYQGSDPESKSYLSLPPLRMCTIGIKAGF